MKRTVNNVRVTRGADIGSSHHLVRSYEDKVDEKTLETHVRHKVNKGDNNRQRLWRWKLKERGGHMHCLHILWLRYYFL